MKITSTTIEQDTNSLLDSFTDAASNLFEVTGRHTTTFEQGFYGFAVAKPTKRMKNALAIDREILVVVATFRDQQQRTIKFTEKKIEESQGRFEPTIAIVLHRDPDGNSKLRNWGRDKGISILSIRDGDTLATGDALERSLCTELYNHDPFDVTGPVSDDSNFYGRREEAIDLARKLQRGQIRSCLGIRKIGKTSIINRVLREIQNSHNCTCLMVDCSRDDVWDLNAAQLLNSITQSAEKAIADNIGYAKLTPTKDNTSISTARTSLESLLRSIKKPFVLVFDEIDYITPGSPTNHQWSEEFNPFWRNLRAAYQECTRQGHTFSMLVAGVSTHWFTVESILNIENAALSFVPEEYLSPMPTGAMVAMLRKLGRIAGLQFDDSAAEEIAKSTANMPYWARKCCSYINRNIPITDRPCEIKAERVIPLIEAFVHEEGAAIAEVALRHLFRVHPELSIAAARCNSDEASQVSERLKRALRRYGIILTNNSLSGQMISAAFQALSVTEKNLELAPTPSIEAGTPNLGIGEWAEELAAIGKRRNLVERKLRELALNFLRYDSMSNGKLSELPNRIVNILPEKSRAQLAHLNSEQALNKFNWTDVVKLIAKEWQLFERLFGDKEQFLRNCDVINDRFDAHAKAADAADFALYRRSLTYIEDRLAKVQ